MTWAEQIESAAQHYATLAQRPGWFQHCKQTVIEMEAMHDGHCWGGLRKRWGALLTQAGLTPSNAEASRKLKERAVRIDGEVFEDPQRAFAPGFEAVLQVGKRSFVRIRLMHH